MRSPEMLRCESIKKAFGGVVALADVSIGFPETGVVAIIGPNGAGKTTLLNILTGFLAPDSGRWHLGAQELTGLPPHRIARLGITRTFQELRLVREVSALENVMLARPRQKGEGLVAALTGWGWRAEEAVNRAEALRLLQFVGLEHADQDAGSLSYGQQKLLSLAMCLAADARVLLLDEPVAGVHPELVGRILSLLKRIAGDGRLVVFIEHNIAAVRQVADEVIVLDDGAVVAQGRPDVVLSRDDILEAYLA